MRRKIFIALAAVVALACALAGVAVWQNTYDLREEKISFSNGPHTLKGVLALPKTGRGPYGLVVFVHGDGPVEATAETFYRPMWEAFAKAGYASLSWSKPGIGGSTGNWLEQSMDDRATETEAGIAWARRRADLDPRRIGLWGASQAGWVLPKVARNDPALKFMIAVSPAINWSQQGRFNLLAEAKAAGTSPAEVQKQVESSDRIRALVRSGATYDQYVKEFGKDEMTAARWTFIQKNHRSDATADLTGLKTPTFLALAGHDLNVDVADTERVYRRLLTGLTVTKYPDATHAMVKVESSSLEFLRAVFAPRSLYADGFLDDLTRYVSSVGRT
jgi:dienelactone hydrolase